LIESVRWSGEQAQASPALTPLRAADHAQTVEDFVNKHFAAEPALLPGLLERARRLIEEVQDAPAKNQA
ncbi:MAG: hypothetical protein M3348_13255, partial [Acidobacteriota bacterium]|nr:hypothetical protein [Acidobacteriota bacterium]